MQKSTKIAALPYLIWMAVFIVVPLVLIFAFAFTTTVKVDETGAVLSEEQVAELEEEYAEALEIDPALTGIDLLYAESVVADMLENQKEKYPRFFRE